MRVGIMLRHIGMRGGIGAYTRNLLDQLLPLSPTGHFVLYYDSAEHLGRYAAHLNVEERVVTAPTRLEWDQWAVPRAIGADRLDVLFNPKLSVPLFGRVPGVFVLHGPEIFLAPEAYSPVDRIQARSLYPLYARKAAAIMVSTEDSREKAIRHLRADPARLHVIPPGVSPTFRPRPAAEAEAVRLKYGLPPDFLLFAGGLYPIKNFGRAVEALALLRRELGEATPPLVAVGFMRWRMERELASIQALGMADRVLFPGYLPQEDLIALHSAARAFVFPSLYEGFGLAALEALACGCPLVTSDRGGTAELGRDAALLVDPYRPDAIAGAILALLRDEGLRDRLRGKGLARAATFTWPKMALGVRALLEGCAAGRAAPAGALTAA